MAYYRMMVEAPKPSVAGIEDFDFPNNGGAYWDEADTTVHKGFGLSGAVPNGVMRDLGDLAPGFAVLAGSLGPSHAFVHVKEIGTPVSIFALSLAPGEPVDGAVVVAQDVIGVLSGAITKMRKAEALVLESPPRPDFDFAAYEADRAAPEQALT